MLIQQLAVQAISHVPHVESADLVVARALVPLADLAVEGAEDNEKELRVAGGVLELSSPAAPLEPGGAVRAQAVLEFFKRSARTRVTPTPPAAASRVSGGAMVQESLRPNGPPLTPTSLGPGNSHRINLRGAVGGEMALDQSMIGGLRSPPVDDPDGDYFANPKLVKEQDSSLLMMSNDYGVSVTVQQAKHLPKVCSATSDSKSIPPNAYVLYRWYNQRVSTHTIRSSAAPAWHHSRMCTMPLDVTAGMEPGKHPLKRKLEFRVYHKVLQVSDGTVNGGDLLIGTAEVDLSPLLYTGFEELNGWYHVVDFKGEGQGEIKLQVRSPLIIASLFLFATQRLLHSCSWQHQFESSFPIALAPCSLLLAPCSLLIAPCSLLLAIFQ